VWHEPERSEAVLHFSVSDTGVGIRAERIGELFQPFAQGDTSITRVYGGTGLGLMICKHLVEMMGGHITVNSQPGAGSTFRFTVRCSAADMSQIPVDGTQVLPRATRQQRVLVVDDNAINLKVAAAMLQRLGYRPDTVASGTEALSAVQKAMDANDPYAVALIDSHMPDLDGTATARALREKHGQSGPVMVGASASSLGEDRQLCLEAGMADYLTKPLELEQLAHTLRRVAPEPAPQSTLAAAGSLEGPSVSLGPLGLIDPQRLEAFAEFDDASGSLRRQVVSDFLDSLPARISDIERAAAGANASALRQVTHVLKGAAGNVGAVGLVRCCERIDAQAHEKALAHALVCELRQMADATATALKAL
jgi:CheY-like chemotaxis protein/HPt (histidine-containing phosphotransfer) domain-containing protein